MKRSLALLVFCGGVLAPGACGQVSCEEMRRAMSEAKSAFDEIAGSKIDDEHCEARHLIGGARECCIDLSG